MNEPLTPLQMRFLAAITDRPMDAAGIYEEYVDPAGRESLDKAMDALSLSDDIPHDVSEPEQ